jgi:2-phospho-L-lactate guanylyltransferase
MLAHTVETLMDIPELEQVLVISRDPEALAVARDCGARTVREDGSPHLNIALTRATAVATTYAAQGVLILPADLPQLTKADVMAMVEAAEETRVVVIAPDHRREGTNAMLVKPAGLIQYDFGKQSFDRHFEQAKSKGVTVKVIELPSLAHDVDLPEDLQFLNGDIENWLAGEEKNEEVEKATHQEEILS